MCVGGGGGGEGSLNLCIDWEPVILPQTSPTKDAWKSHTDVLPPLQLPNCYLKPPYTSTTLVVSDRQTVILHLQTIYVYTECARGWGEVVVPDISHGEVTYP